MLGVVGCVCKVKLGSDVMSLTLPGFTFHPQPNFNLGPLATSAAPKTLIATPPMLLLLVLLPSTTAALYGR
jgi:hypothetical protein